MAFLETEIDGVPSEAPAETSQKSPRQASKRPKVYGSARIIRMRRAVRRAQTQFLLALGLAAVFFPALAVATLTADMPIFWFDGIVDAASLRPSSWMKVADFWFLTGLFGALLATRKFGADVVVQALTVAWIALGVGAFAMFVFLAPELTAADMPSALYVTAMFGSWYVGPLCAAHFYDLQRGTIWWRAPLYGAFLGVVVQTLLYFPIAYRGAGVPWGQWWAIDLIIKIGAVLIFVGVYSRIRKRLRPLPNLGGHAG